MALAMKSGVGPSSMTMSDRSHQHCHGDSCHGCVFLSRVTLAGAATSWMSEPMMATSIMIHST